MDPHNIPFNALIVGPTNSGKTHFLVNQLCGPFCGKFDYVVLICPTFVYNKTLYGFAERDPRLYVIIYEQHQVEFLLKVASFSFEGTNALIVLDDCAASKDVKGRTGELVKLGFSARHAGISVWVLTQQLSSIAKPFRENVAAIVMFYTPSAKTIPWSQRLSCILNWQILRREPLLFICFYWHEALRAEKRKPLVKTVGNLTFMPSAFDRRF